MHCKNFEQHAAKQVTCAERSLLQNTYILGLGVSSAGLQSSAKDSVSTPSEQIVLSRPLPEVRAEGCVCLLMSAVILLARLPAAIESSAAPGKELLLFI